MSTYEDKILEQLKRIADAQSSLLEIAQEARAERKKLSVQMQERFKAGFAQSKEQYNDERD